MTETESQLIHALYIFPLQCTGARVPEGEVRGGGGGDERAGGHKAETAVLVGRRQ